MLLSLWGVIFLRLVTVEEYFFTIFSTGFNPMWPLIRIVLKIWNDQIFSVMNGIVRQRIHISDFIKTYMKAKHTGKHNIRESR